MAFVKHCFFVKTLLMVDYTIIRSACEATVIESSDCVTRTSYSSLLTDQAWFKMVTLYSKMKCLGKHSYAMRERYIHELSRKLVIFDTVRKNSLSSITDKNMTACD